MLGVGLDLPYEEGCVELKSGDHLLFMTDGVTEARDSRGQFLGSEGASRLLALSAAESTSQKIIARIDTELSWFTGGIYRDDVAMLLVTCTSES
jgi:sigma-B regulation protein RsbU (phosphoserine phosphatase)